MKKDSFRHSPTLKRDYLWSQEEVQGGDDGVPGSWSLFDASERAKTGFKRMSLQHRFVQPTHQPTKPHIVPKLTNGELERTPEYLLEMRRLGMHGLQYGPDRLENRLDHNDQLNHYLAAEHKPRHPRPRPEPKS